MREEDIRRIAEEVARQVISQHRHDDLGSVRLELGEMQGVPLNALTASTGTNAGSTYTSTTEALINNHTTRINQLEDRLQSLGLIR